MLLIGDITTDSRKEYITERGKESSKARDFMTEEFKVNNRGWISKEQRDKIMNNQYKKKDSAKILKEFINIELEYNKKLINKYYVEKFDRTRGEGVKVNKMLAPLGILYNG